MSYESGEAWKMRKSRLERSRAKQLVKPETRCIRFLPRVKSKRDGEEFDANQVNKFGVHF